MRIQSIDMTIGDASEIEEITIELEDGRKFKLDQYDIEVLGIKEVLMNVMKDDKTIEDIDTEEFLDRIMVHRL